MSDNGNDTCKCRYPKNNRAYSCADEYGFANYPRSSTGFSVERGGILCDNQWVPPYNHLLPVRLQCQINVEVCSSFKATEHIFKYVHTGSDSATAQQTLTLRAVDTSPKSSESPHVPMSTYQVRAHSSTGGAGRPSRDKVKTSLNARYVPAIEAVWRIFHLANTEYPPPVSRLTAHLLGHCMVYFHEDGNRE